MRPATGEFKKAQAFVDSEGTKDSRLLCDLFFEKEQNKSVTISLRVSMPDYDAGPDAAFVLSFDPPHLDKKRCRLQFPTNDRTNKGSNKKADRKAKNKATLSLVLRENKNCVIWRPSKRKVQNDISKPGPRYSQFMNIVQANIVHVEFSANNRTKSLYDLELILASLSKRKGFRAEYAFKGMERWNKPVFPCNKNNKCNTQHLPNIGIPTQGAASLTHLPDVSVPETDHSGSPDEKNEQRLVLVPDSQRSVLTNSATDHSGSPDEKNEQHSVLVPDSQRSVLTNSAPESPSSLVYVPDAMRSPGSPCLVPTLSQIYQREDRRELICPRYTDDLPFGGRGPSPEQDPIGSPTRNLPASPDTPGPTPLVPNEPRLQPLVLGSPTIPSSTRSSCLPALGAKQPQLINSFVPLKTLEASAQFQEFIENLVTKSVTAHGRRIEEHQECRLALHKQDIVAECTRIVSNFNSLIEDIVKTSAAQHFRDFLNGGYDDLDPGTDVGTAKKKELDEERKQLDLEEEELRQEKKKLHERKHHLNKRKRKVQEQLDSLERRQILYNRNPR